MNGNKEITEALIRVHFAPQIQVERKLGGVFYVTTPDGGEVEITQTTYKIYVGGRDVYRSIVSLGHDAWGSITVHGGHEQVLGMLAHGESQGVNIIPEVKGSGGGCVRVVLVAIIFIVAAQSNTPDNHAMFGAFAISVLLWRFLKRREKRAARRRGQIYRDVQPEIYGDTRDASRDDAARKGWL